MLDHGAGDITAGSAQMRKALSCSAFKRLQAPGTSSASFLVKKLANEVPEVRARHRHPEDTPGQDSVTSMPTVVRFGVDVPQDRITPTPPESGAAAPGSKNLRMARTEENLSGRG